jgi:hypothetical protein
VSDVVRGVALIAVGIATGNGWAIAAGVNVLYAHYTTTDGAFVDPNERKSDVFNQTSSDAPIPVYYGFAHVENPIIVFRDRVQNNNGPSGLLIVAVIGEGEIGGVDAVYIDGVHALDPKFSGAHMPYPDVKTGTDNQSPSLFLQVFSTKFTDQDIGAGVSYAVLLFEENTVAFPGREPKITFDIRGKKVKDTRDGVTRFSPNAALCIRDYCTDSRYGRRVAEAKIDDAKITAEANYFEERIAMPAMVSTFTADPATDVLTLPAAQPLQTADEVMLTTTVALPAPLALSTAYYWIPVSPTTGKVATTAANAQAGIPIAIDITSAGSGVHTLERTPVFSVDPVWDHLILTKEAPFDNGDGVQLSSTGALPGGTAAATTYYWMRGAGDVLAGFQNPAITSRPPELRPARVGRIATTYANALAGIAIDLTTAGTGTLTVTHIDQPRYTCSGGLDPSANPFDNFAKLRSSCRSWFFEAGGLYHLVADKLTAPSAFALTVDNIVGRWSFGGGDPSRHYNRVEAHFRNALKNYEEDVEPSDSAAERTLDGERLMIGTLTLDMTTNPYMAQRLAQLERRCSRLGLPVGCNVHVQGFKAMPGDVIAATHPTPGWAGKLSRLALFDHAADDEYRIELQEYADSVYTMDAQAATAIPERTSLQALFNQTQSVPPAVQGLEISEQ